jgi:hypothetical protein
VTKKRRCLFGVSFIILHADLHSIYGIIYENSITLLADYFVQAKPLQNEVQFSVRVWGMSVTDRAIKFAAVEPMLLFTNNATHLKLFYADVQPLQLAVICYGGLW